MKDRGGIVACVAIAVLFAAGCTRAIRQPDPSKDPTAHVLPNVPFFADSTDQCGPSTLASVLSYWHRPTEPSELKQEIYLPNLKGTLPMDLLPAVRARGLTGKVYSGSLENLKAELKAGHPLLAYLNLGYSFAPFGHYVVVTGFDDEKGGIYMHSGKNQNKFTTYKKFARSWDKTDRWTLLVLPTPDATNEALR